MLFFNIINVFLLFLSGEHEFEWSVAKCLFLELTRLLKLTVATTTLEKTFAMINTSGNRES